MLQLSSSTWKDKCTETFSSVGKHPAHTRPPGQAAIVHPSQVSWCPMHRGGRAQRAQHLEDCDTAFAVLRLPLHLQPCLPPGLPTVTSVPDMTLSGCTVGSPERAAKMPGFQWEIKTSVYSWLCSYPPVQLYVAQPQSLCHCSGECARIWVT